MTTIQPTTQSAFWQIDADQHGVTELAELTGVQGGIPVVWGEGEDGFMEVLATTSVEIPPLPPAGTELQRGAAYTWNGQTVIVRQSHRRTEHAPTAVPALFTVAGDGVNWIAGESVTRGTRRLFNGTLYECLQAHVTQADWTPPAVPALWAAVVVPPPGGGVADWATGVAYAINDCVMFNGTEYRCLQAHTSQAGWTPVAVPALWAVA